MVVWWQVERRESCSRAKRPLPPAPAPRVPPAAPPRVRGARHRARPSTSEARAVAHRAFDRGDALLVVRRAAAHADAGRDRKSGPSAARDAFRSGAAHDARGAGVERHAREREHGAGEIVKRLREARRHVRGIVAREDRDGDHARRAACLADARTAAAIISGPPVACTVSRSAPSPCGETAAPFTVFGMSCSEIEDTRRPRALNFANDRRPFGGEQLEPEFRAPAPPSTSFSASASDRGHVERDGEIGGGHLVHPARIRSAATTRLRSGRLAVSENSRIDFRRSLRALVG